MSIQRFAMHLYYDELQKRFLLYSTTGMDSHYLTYVGPVQAEAEVPFNFDLAAHKLAMNKAKEARLRAFLEDRLADLLKERAELQAAVSAEVTQ